MSKKCITLRKGDIKINLEYRKKKVVVHYEFPEKEKENLNDYLYLLENIERYIKSGEYDVVMNGVKQEKTKEVVSESTQS